MKTMIPQDAELLERIRKLEAALIEHLDLYWGPNWKFNKNKNYTAYGRLARARKALGMEE